MTKRTRIFFLLAFILCLPVAGICQATSWGTGTYGQNTVPAGLGGALQICSGYKFDAALLSNGLVTAWGDNSAGETNTSALPERATAISISRGGAPFGLALNKDGTVAGWGDNSAGEITPPSGLNGVIAIAAGDSLYGLALKDNGTVVGWGNNQYGQTTIPAGLTNVIAIGATYYNGIALKSDGTLTVWGNTSSFTSNLPNLTGVTAIACGYNFGVALESNGTVVAWGDGNDGDTTVPAALTGVVAIAAGTNTALAVRSNGTVVAWGDNSQGEASVPTNLFGVTQVSVGYDSSLALTPTTTAVAYGSLGSTTVQIPPGLTGIQAISANALHSLALLPNGMVVAWGSDGSGESNVPPGLRGVKAIAAGYTHSLALLANGTVVAWGDNSSGACSVPAFSAGVKAISAGMGTSYALLDDGTVVAWGANASGQATVPDIGGVKAISAGMDFCVALQDNGSIAAWGDNSVGQSTPPTQNNSLKAISAGPNFGIGLYSNGIVGGWGSDSSGQLYLDGWAATTIYAGYYYTLITESGEGYGSGYNYQSQLPPSLGGITAMTGGQGFTLLLAPPAVLGVSYSPASVVGGAPATCTVTVSPPAGPGGEVVTLEDDPGVLTTPATITVPEGEDSVSFQVTTQSVSSVTDANVVARLGGTSAAGGLFVNPITITSFSFAAFYPAGGTTAIGTISLNGPAPVSGHVVNLSGTGPLTVPTTVTVPEGKTSATFQLPTSPVSSPTPEVVDASDGITTLDANFIIEPPSLLDFKCLTPTVTGGALAQFAISLNGPAASGQILGLNSNPNQGLAEELPIPAGAVTYYFEAPTHAVQYPTPVTVTASTGSNGPTLTVTFTVNPAVVSAFKVAPAAVTGGANIEATVSINGPTLTYGTYINTSSSNPAVTVPAAVKIPYSSTFNFSLKTNAVSASTPVTISASALNGPTLTATVTVNPAFLTSVGSGLSLAPGGQAASTLTLSSIAGPTGDAVSLVSSNPGVIVPSTVTVPKGGTGAVYLVKAGGVDAFTVATVTGTFGGVSKTEFVTVSPATMTSFSLSPTSVVGGVNTEAKVQLSGPAGPSGLVITFNSTSASITMPASIKVPSGSSSYSFVVRTKTVTATTPVTVTASSPGQSLTATVSLTK